MMVTIKFLYKLSGYSIFFFLSIFFVKAQNNAQLYDSIEISLLTCGTGTAEVYQAYGHTGVRVVNYTRNTDIVYNYGMFDFYEDNFLWKFVRGKLLYFVATEPFENFMLEYHYFGRSVREQILDLNPKQKSELVTNLQNNALPENRYYLYDFIYNNCSTQPRDLIQKSISKDFTLQKLSSENTETIRQMIDRHMKYNEWLDLGIDLVLGMRLDQKADASTRMFLPEELMIAFDSTMYNDKPIVKASNILYSGNEQKHPKLLDPTIAFWLLFTIIILVQVYIKSDQVHKVIGATLLTTTGLIGWLLVFMWWGTDHYMTKWNLNLLWAVPLYLPLSWFFHKANSSKPLRLSLHIFRLISILVLIGWCWLPQQFHSAVIPIILILIWALGVYIPNGQKQQ